MSETVEDIAGAVWSGVGVGPRERLEGVAAALARLVPAADVRFIAYDPREVGPAPQGGITPGYVSQGSPFRDVARGISVQGIVDEAAGARYLAEGLGYDRLARVLVERPGHAAAVSDVYSAAELRRRCDPYVDDYCFGTGIREILGVHVPLAPDLRLAMGVCRAPRQRAFGSDERRLFAALSRDVGDAFLASVLLAPGGAPPSGEPVQAAWLVVDAVTGEVVRRDEAALALVREIDAGGLDPLGLLLGATRAFAARATGCLRRTLPLRGGGALVASWSHVRTSPRGSSIVLLLERREPSPRERFEAAALAARLTARERDVVWLTACGLGVRGVANALGLRPVTVKLHLRAAYAKTGRRRQAALVAHLLGRDGPVP